MRDALHRIWSLVVKELQQLRRDKLLMGFIILGPLLELALMGNLVGGGVENLQVAAIDLDRSQASRELVARLDQTEELWVRAYGDSADQAQESMQRGEIAAVVVIPPGYSEQLTDPRQGAEVQVIVDDANFVVASVAAATVENVAAEIVQDLTARHTVGIGRIIDLRFMDRFNATLDDRPEPIIAMLGLIVYQVTLVIAAQSFTRERELGTLEQLRITPMGRLELILGKAIPTLAIGLLDTMLMIGIIAVWFEVPLRGSLMLLLLLTIPFTLVQIGWGTVISLVSRTQQQSVLFVFAIAMLEVACSGFIVPTSDMPAVMHVASYASSVQHYLVILRGVMLRGAGMGSLWVPALSLLGIAFAAIAFAWFRLWLGLDTDSLQQRLRAAWHSWRGKWQERQSDRRARKTRRRGKRKPGWTGKPA